jgi:hypothetical protein
MDVIDESLRPEVNNTNEYHGYKWMLVEYFPEGMSHKKLFTKLHLSH